jgi:hypothetical protein
MISAKPFVFASAFSALSLLAISALAHVELQSPMPRAKGQSEGNLKNTPCGQNADGRTDRVTVFEPGQTITIAFNEFIDHPSYYRVAFDPDGDTFPMRSGVPANAVETIEAARAAEQALFQGTGSVLLAVVPEVNGKASSATVTLPNMECENCTLQLIEFMYDKADPQHGYYQCADIALRSAGTVDPGEGDGDGDGNLGTPDAGAPPSGGNNGSAGAGSSPVASNGGSSSTTIPTVPSGAGGSTSTGVAGSTSTTTNPLQPAGNGAQGLTPLTGDRDDDTEEEGGCSFGRPAHPVGAASALLLVVGLGLLGSLRRRRLAR